MRAAACHALEQAGHAWRQHFSRRKERPPLPVVRCLLCCAEAVPAPGVGRLAETATLPCRMTIGPGRAVGGVSPGILAGAQSTVLLAGEDQLDFGADISLIELQ